MTDNEAFFDECRVQGRICKGAGRRLADPLVTGTMLLLGVHESAPMPAQERPWLYREREEQGRTQHARCYRR
jgi:hypothetical protein